MPLPMVHLAVAVHLQELTGWKLTADYLLGNLSPDAIHMRAGSGRSAKEAVHFHIGSLPEPEALKKIERLLKKGQASSDGLPSFRMGYALHLLTDHYWTRWIVASFKNSLPVDMPDTEKRSLYYRETDQIDFNLYNRMPWRRKVWGTLAAAKPRDFDELLSAEEIQAWLARDLNWFDKIKAEPGIVPIHITDEITAAFIERAAQKAARFFEEDDHRGFYA